MKKKKRVLVVDDHPVVRKGLSFLIEKEPDLTICGECAEGANVLSSIEKSNPDIAILDLVLKDMDGIGLLKDIRQRYPDLPILVLSMHDEFVYAERALRAGATGYMKKDEMLDKVIPTLRQILQGHIYVTENVKDKILTKIVRRSGQADGSILDRLSDREMEVFQLLGQGYSTRRIAERWGRSVKTVETYRANIKRKLDLDVATDLVHFATEWVNKQK